MQTTGNADRDRARKYHIRRAQTRKALTDQIGVAWDRMDERQLWEQAAAALTRVVDKAGEGTDRDLVYSARFALGAMLELMMRGQQLQLPIWPDDAGSRGGARPASAIGVDRE